MEQVFLALHTTYFFLLSKCWMVLPFEMVSPCTLRFFKVRFIHFLSKISFIEFSFVFANKTFNLRINFFVIFFTNMKIFILKQKKKKKKKKKKIAGMGQFKQFLCIIFNSNVLVCRNFIGNFY